jgi:hypothetical protein
MLLAECLPAEGMPGDFSRRERGQPDIRRAVTGDTAGRRQIASNGKNWGLRGLFAEIPRTKKVEGER